MANARPQLNVHELHQLRWLLGGGVGLSGLMAVVYLDIEATLLLLVTLLSGVVVLVKPSLAGRMPAWFHKLAFPLVLSVFVFDIYTFGEVLPALVRLGVLLVWYRLISYRRRRDDLQLVLLGLFLVVTAGVLTISIGFALQIVVFAALSLALLFTRTLVDVAEPGGAEAAPTRGIPAWAHVNWPDFLRRARSVVDWRVWLFAAGLFVGLVVFSAALFMSIPRFQLENSLFLDRWMNKRSVTGFTDTLRFGEVSDIQQDDSIVMRIDVGDRAEMPAEPYWRMVVLDEYREQTFRMSTELKQRGFGPVRTRSGLGAMGMPTPLGRSSWTFYLEPGVSRYLPLLGAFVNLRFTEPQEFRTSDALRMIELVREPSTMKAYRIERMSTAADLRAEARTAEALPMQVRELPFTEAEKRSWREAVDEITGGAELDAPEFAERATRWLHARHAYSLSNTLPRGEEDALVRWAMSREPGHCEYFAGTFVMLARSAGFPARVVGGFLGGAWNEDYLTVRSSHAHAWCEIFSNGRWLRVDPTAPSSDQASTPTQLLERNRSRLQQEVGWAARLDRLRMLWYRRVVQFDREDQAGLLKAVKARTEGTRRWISRWIGDGLQKVRTWLSGPWDVHRAFQAGAGTALVVLAWILWRRRARFWLARWRSPRGRGVDPVRREAGEWLRRLRAIPGDGAEVAAVEQTLLRLRYGARESWPDSRAVFRQARGAVKRARRGRRVSE